MTLEQTEIINIIIWLLEHIYILSIFAIGKVKNFFTSIKTHFETVDKTLILLTERSEQQDKRLSNLERKY